MAFLAVVAPVQKAIHDARKRPNEPGLYDLSKHTKHRHVGNQLRVIFFKMYKGPGVLPSNGVGHPPPPVPYTQTIMF